MSSSDRLVEEPELDKNWHSDSECPSLFYILFFLDPGPHDKTRRFVAVISLD
jgi:hypothetical protein